MGRYLLFRGHLDIDARLVDILCDRVLQPRLVELLRARASRVTAAAKLGGLVGQVVDSRQYPEELTPRHGTTPGRQLHAEIDSLKAK